MDGGKRLSDDLRECFLHDSVQDTFVICPLVVSPSLWRWVPEERVSKRIVEQIAQSVLAGRIKDQDAEQNVDVLCRR